MKDLQEFRRQKDEFFRSSHHSPLLPEQKADFQGLRYFPPNAEFELALEVEQFPPGDEVLMQTNTGDVQRYARFGRFAVDFNLAYNPYCAYNEAWSCPITPAENRLKLPIRAGEMVFHSPE